ncbi:MAG: hypothetical protein ABSG82_01930 [Sedimentisphaerales bacterium]|jgi:hypothetical protein
MSKTSKSVCYLCGKAIEPKPKSDPMELSWDHVPPRQFYPKQIRKTQKLNLVKAPSHAKCNGDYKDDEEYFYHSLYPIVAKNNPQMGIFCSQDIQRRAQKPQTHTIIQKILSTEATITEGGIHLPKGLSRFTLEEGRLERVAAKIARGVLFLATERYFEEQQITHMKQYNDPSEVIEPYKLAWQLSPFSGVYPKVFSFSHLPLEGFHHLSMFFWESFMFCVTVKDTAA